MKKKILSFFLVLALMLPFITNGLAASMLSAAPSGALESFELHKTYHKMAVNKTATFSIVNPVPADTSTLLSGTWSSSDPAVVKMTGNAPGQVKSVADGVATITCEIDGVTASVTVVVGDGVAVESFALEPDRITIEAGTTLALQVSDILPANANNMATAKWFSSNSDVVAFTDVAGEIKALKAGYSTITCQIGAVKAYTKVFVEEITDPGPSWDPNDLDLVQVIPMMMDAMQEDYVPVKIRLFDEYTSVLNAPPFSANPYMPPIDSGVSENANAWRSPGGTWTTANTVAKFDMLREWDLKWIYVYDGDVYAPSTYTADGSAPYEVMGGTVKIYAGERLLFSYDLTNEGKWVAFDLEKITNGTVIAREMTVVKEQDISPDSTYRYSWSAGPGGWTSPKGEYVCDVNVTEIAMYGIPLGENPDLGEEWELQVDGRPVTDFNIPFGEFVGTNSFFNDNLNAYEAIGFIREYHNWMWTEYSCGDQPNTMLGGAKNNTAETENPEVQFMNTWNSFDNYYQNLKDRGVNVSICIQGGVASDRNAPPAYQGTKDKKDPHSYLAHAQSLFQHAARYGSNTDIDLDLIRVAPGTEKRVGLGLVEYYENWNEPNLGGHWTGAQFAAMTSADYDGHMNSMGPDAGIKNADPNAKLVMGGLAGMIFEEGKYNAKDWTCTEFVKDMLRWFDENRTEEAWLEHNATLDGYVKYPFDVLNGHYYCPDGSAPTGVSPEADRMYERLMDFMEFRALYLPDKEIWMSEFGWDSAQGSPQSATVEYVKDGRTYNPGINVGLDGEEVQGRWLVREYLLMAAAGLDRVQQFMMPNTSADVNNPGRFATCGLTRGTQGNTDYKPAWYYIGTMKYYLNDFKFASLIEQGGTDGLTGPWVLKFDEVAGDNSTYTMWLPTSLGDQNGANKVDYNLTLSGDHDHAYLVEMQDKVKWGVVTELDVVDGVVTVPVTEKPVFVITCEGEYYKPVPQVLDARLFTVNKLTQSNNDPSLLFDEQWNDSPAIANSWKPGAPGRYAIIDLGAKYDVTNVLLWDINSSLTEGKVFAVYAGELGDWTPNYGNESAANVQAKLASDNWERIVTYDYMNYAIWFDGKTVVTTRYLIVGFEDGPNPGPNSDQWKADAIDVPEIRIKGTLAKGETPPEAWKRTFEEKPSEDSNTFLFDNDFDGGVSISTSAGTATIIDGLNADGTEGKILRITGTGAYDVKIDSEYLEDMVMDTWYNLDFKFKTEDNTSAPSVYLIDNGQWRPIVGRTGDATFKPHWGNDTQNRVAARDEWHRLNVRIKINSGTGHISYEVYYDEQLVGTSTMTDASISQLPLDTIYIRMNSGTGNGVTYIDDVWLYTKTLKPKITLDLADMTIGAVSWSGTPTTDIYAQRAARLFDQQTLDPISDSAAPSGDYFNYAGRSRYMLVDLGAEYDITDLYMYNRNAMDGDARFTMWYATSLGDWSTAFTAQITEANLLTRINAFNSGWTQACFSFYPTAAMWVSESVNARVRYIVFTALGDSGSGISHSEWIFYGTPAEGGEPTVTPTPTAEPTPEPTVEPTPEPTPPPSGEAQKLEMDFADMTSGAITWGNVPNITTDSYATRIEQIFDQQDSVDPAVDGAAPGGYTYWGHGRTDNYILLDLGAEYDITDIYIYGRPVGTGDVTNFVVWYSTSLGDWDTAFTAKITAANLIAKLDAADSGWTKGMDSDSFNSEKWVSQAINGKVRYLVFGNMGTGKNTEIKEWVFYGAPAAEPTPEPTPEPDYIFKLDLDNMAVGAVTPEIAQANGFGIYGANYSVAEWGDEKVLSFEGSANQDVVEFKIDNAGTLLSPDVAYVFEFDFLIEDDFSAPSLYFGASDWSWSTRLFDRAGNLHLNSRWYNEGGSNPAYVLAKDEWHTMKVEFVGYAEGGHAFTLTLDGNYLVSYTVAATDGMSSITPYDIMRLEMRSGNKANQSIACYRNIALYEAE